MVLLRELDVARLAVYLILSWRRLQHVLEDGVVVQVMLRELMGPDVLLLISAYMEGEERRHIHDPSNHEVDDRPNERGLLVVHVAPDS